jgi:protein-S-isoprenylcysteine O-methyltransferase Ste14
LLVTCLVSQTKHETKEVPPMAVAALVLLAAWLLLVAGLRTLIQLRRTGDASAPRFRDRPGSPQWWARLLSAVGFACAVAAPLAELAGLEPIGALDRSPVRAAGAVLAVLGIAGTLAAQLAMGGSWRPDVDPDARTALVTTGPFRLVRNPIFTATAATATGLALLVPNLLAVAMLVAFVTALQVQVRLVEEPYLHRVHGTAWGAVGRTDRTLPPLDRAVPPRHEVGVGTTRESESSYPHARVTVDRRPTGAGP